MDPRILLSEVAYYSRHGHDIGSRLSLWRDCLTSRFSQTWSSTGQPAHQVRLRFGAERFSLWLRNNGSDIQILTALFKDSEYEAPGIDWKNIRTIVDAGANIGISTVWFHLRAPQARIVAVEPEPENIHMLRRNIETNQIPCDVLAAAVWHVKGTMRLGIKPAAMSHSLIPDENGFDSEIEIKTLDMPYMLSKLGPDGADLVKMDIEGAEKEVLRYGEGWVRSVKQYLMECHPGRGLDGSEAAAVLGKFGFETHLYNQITNEKTCCLLRAGSWRR